MQNSLILLSLTLSSARVWGYIRDDCFCGVGNTEARRITNGVVTTAFKYPWMVVLLSAHNKAFCGGTLISDSHVTNIQHHKQLL